MYVYVRVFCLFFARPPPPHQLEEKCRLLEALLLHPCLPQLQDAASMLQKRRSLFYPEVCAPACIVLLFYLLHTPKREERRGCRFGFGICLFCFCHVPAFLAVVTLWAWLSFAHRNGIERRTRNERGRLEAEEILTYLQDESCKNEQ